MPRQQQADRGPAWLGLDSQHHTPPEGLEGRVAPHPAIDKLHGTNYVTNLGWTTKLRNSSADLDLVLEVSRVEEIPSPVPYSDIEDLVPQRFHEYLVHEGRMSEGTGRPLLAR